MASTSGATGELTVYPNSHISDAEQIIQGPDGGLWFAEASASAGFGLGRIDTSGNFSFFNVATNRIAPGPDGNVWFTLSPNVAPPNGAIGKITPSGTVTDYPIAGGVSPVVITPGPDGALWFIEETLTCGSDGSSACGGNTIGRITTSGQYSSFPSPCPADPNGIEDTDWITTGPDGALWVSCGNSTSSPAIGRITTDGVGTTYPLSTSDDPSGYPFDVASGPNGALWFEASNTSIGEISTSGTVQYFTDTTHLSSPRGFAEGPDGNLWFADGSSVGNISPTGQISTYSEPPNGNVQIPDVTWMTSGPDSAMWFVGGNGSDNYVGRVTTSVTPEAPAITSANAATASVGSALSFSVTTTGNPTPSLSETGSLPNGVSFVDNGDGTASLSGTPASGSAGSYPIILMASNGVGTDASQSFTLTVAQKSQSVHFTSTPPTNATKGGSPYTAAASASSGLPVTITVDTSASSVCSIASNVVSFIGAGTCTLDANQSGNADYSAAPQVQQSFTVASSSKTPITANGSATCANLSGSIKFNPPLFNNGTSNAESASLKVKLSSLTSGCSTTATNLPTGGILFGTATTTFTTNTTNGSANACGGFETSQAVSMTIKWTYKNSSGVTVAKVAPTTVTFSGFDALGNSASEPGYDFPQDSGGIASATGSFTGSDGGASSNSNIFAGKNSTFITTKCSSSTGLTTLKLGGAGTTVDPSQAMIG